MINNKDITDEIQRLSSFRILVETYEEIAASRMRKVRASVLQSRDFITELAAIFETLKRSYRAQVENLIKDKKQPKQSATFRQHNQKTLALLISANTGLYGAILQSTITSFIDYISSHDCDVAIIGRYGKSVFENRKPGQAFTFFEFPDQSFTPEDTVRVFKEILPYSNIYVFHGKFISIVRQEPTMDIITAENRENAETHKDVVKYVFEPSLEEILTFFEEEILAGVFEQSLHEAELAKFASRMVTLDNATQSIKDRVTKVEMMKRLIHHRAINKKQQDSLTGMRLWKK